MMELEKQVCSFELAKRLKELGAKQESLFLWTDETVSCVLDIPVYSGNGTLWENPEAMSEINDTEPISAYTCAELGEMLPYSYAVIKNKYGFNIFGHSSSNKLDYTMLGGHQISLPTGLTEADARAKMLIYLLENNLII